MRLWQRYLLVKRRQTRRSRARQAVNQPVHQATRGLVLSLAVVFALLLIAASAAYASLTDRLPSVDSLTLLLNPTDGLLLQPTRLYDRTGQTLLYRLESPGASRRYLPINPALPEHISTQLVQCVISLFEPDFWQSPGADLSRLTDPAPYTLAERLVEQLLTDEPADARRALRMRLLAVQVTARFGRSQVLEWYLNSATYGHLAIGAEAAAHLYLGKSAAQLNLAEAALLTAAIEAPTLNPLDARSAALEHQVSVLDRLLQRRVIPPEEHRIARSYNLGLQPALQEPPNIAPAFTSAVLDQLSQRFGRARLERGGLIITTTLDAGLQNQLNCTLQAQLNRLANGSSNTPADCTAAALLPALPAGLSAVPAGVQAAAVLLDPQTGEVLALVGDSTSSQLGSQPPRHAPGSLLSPFLALSAFKNSFSPASLVWDIPGQLPLELESQSNPTEKYRGPMRLRLSLANDYLNPQVQLLRQLGPVSVWRLSEALGLTGLADSQNPEALLFDGPSLPLLDLASAYSVFANQGALTGQRLTATAPIKPALVLEMTNIQGRSVLESAAPERQSVLSPALAYLVHHVLADETARWPSLGYPNALEIGRPAGAKTGQTANGQSVWAAGYTPQRLAVVWVGLPQDTPTNVKLDVRAAAGIWNAAMQYVGRSLPATDWTAPSEITNLAVCDPSGLLPTRACPTVVTEVFLLGTEPTGTDILYRTFQVNRETGRLATVFSPPELVEARTYLVAPSEAAEWVRLTGLPLPPSQYDVIQPPAALPNANLQQPALFAYVQDVVTLTGTAAGDDLAVYRLQTGQGINPVSWVQIGPDYTIPVVNGTLGEWNTQELGDGLYALRLQVVRQNQRVETATIQVTVDNTHPELRSLLPVEGQQLQSSSGWLTLQAAASDNVGLRQVEWLINGLSIGVRSQAPYSLPWQTTPGRYVLVIMATDLAGNTRQVGPIQFEVK